jgi:hypothetical protein
LASRASGNEGCGSGESIEFVFESSKGGREIARCCRISDPGEASSQEAVVGTSEEERDPRSLVGGSVSVRSGNALDEAVEPESAEIVGHAAGREVGWTKAEELSEKRAEVAVGEAVELKSEDDDGSQQCMNSRIAEAKGRCSLFVDDDWLRNLVEGSVADNGVVTESLSVEKASVGCAWRRARAWC